MGRPARTASSIKRSEDSRPAASGTTACGNTTRSRRGRIETVSGTAGSVGPPSVFILSVMACVLSARSEDIHGLELGRGGPEQGFPAATGVRIAYLAHFALHIPRQVLDLGLHIEHPPSHL